MKSRRLGWTTVSVLTLGLGLLVQGCSGVDPRQDSESVQGIFMSATADFPEEGRVDKLYWLETAEGKKYSLHFNEAFRIGPWDEIVVQGIREGDEILVDSYQVLRSALGEIDEQRRVEEGRSMIIDPPPLAPPLKVLWISCCNSVDAKKADEFHNNNPKGIKQYFAHGSYGIWTYDILTLGPYTCSDPKSAEAAAEKAGIKVKEYDQVQAQQACSGGGFGLDGYTPLRSATPDNPRGKFNRYSNVGGMTCGLDQQEIGHNYGMAHSHWCPGAIAPDRKCSGFSEYGNPFTAMASGCGAFTAWERIQMNWFGGCNVITVKGSGSYEIGPINYPCNGPQVIMLAAGQTENFDRYYYLEYRKPFGADTTEGVLLHYASDPRKGGWQGCDWNGPDCPYSFIIDPLGGSAVKGALMTAGKQFKTPQGVEVKIASLGETAKFDINFTTGGDKGAVCWSDNDKPFDDPTVVCKKGGTGGTGGGGAGGAGTGGGPTTGGTAGTGGAGGAMGGKGGTGATGGADPNGGSGGTNPTGGTIGTGATGATGAGGSSTGGATGGTAGGVGEGGTGGTGATGGGGRNDGETGCGCRVVSGDSRAISSRLSWLLGGMALLRVRRRRRRR